MEAALFNDLITTIRTEQEALFATTETGVVDMGQGKSAVAIQLTEALAAASLTFRGLSDEEARATPASLTGLLKSVQTGADAALIDFTIVIDGTEPAGTFIPLEVPTFNGCRFLTCVSSVDQDGKGLAFVSKAI